MSDIFTAAFGVEPVDVSKSILGEDKSISEKPDTKGEALPDITTDKYLGFDLKGISFVNDKWIVKAADTMRPFIRGFIVLLMIFYNINQFLSFIGAGTLSSLGSAINSHQPVMHHDMYQTNMVDMRTGEVVSSSSRSYNYRK